MTRMRPLKKVKTSPIVITIHHEDYNKNNNILSTDYKDKETKFRITNQYTIKA